MAGANSAFDITRRRCTAVQHFQALAAPGPISASSLLGTRCRNVLPFVRRQEFDYTAAQTLLRRHYAARAKIRTGKATEASRPDGFCTGYLKSLQFSPCGQVMAVVMANALFVQQLYNGKERLRLADSNDIPGPIAFAWQNNGSICHVEVFDPATLRIRIFEEQMPMCWGRQAHASAQFVPLPYDAGNAGTFRVHELSVAPSAQFCIAVACSGIQLVGQGLFTIFLVDLQLNRIQAAHALPGPVQQCEWNESGTLLAFATVQKPVSTLWLLKAAEGTLTSLTSSINARQMLSPFSPFWADSALWVLKKPDVGSMTRDFIWHSFENLQIEVPFSELVYPAPRGHLSIALDGGTPNLYGVYDRTNSCWVTKFYALPLHPSVFAWSPCLNFVAVTCEHDQDVLVYPTAPTSKARKYVQPLAAASKLIRQGGCRRTLLGPKLVVWSPDSTALVIVSKYAVDILSFTTL